VGWVYQIARNVVHDHHRQAAKQTVALADDHPIVRAGLRAELEKIPGTVIVGEAVDGREAIELVRAVLPAVVFMDISMRGLNGLEATARITKEFPQVRVIILSMHQNEEYFWQALKAGASGYLLKKAATTELGAALQRVAAGEIYLVKEMSNQLIKKLPLQHLAHQKTPLESLSERQREILQLIAEGQTTKAIAYVLKETMAASNTGIRQSAIAAPNNTARTPRPAIIHQFLASGCSSAAACQPATAPRDWVDIIVTPAPSPSAPGRCRD
jgi:DNA-binding NarL/FixJ family response regulator